MSIIEQPKRNMLNDPSLWLLLFSNITTIFFATTENWNLSTILLIYWFQSITIGFFNFIRILQLKQFSTKGLGTQSAQPTRGTKIFNAFFFLFHYGGCHAAYLMFLLTNPFTETYGNIPSSIELKFILLTALLFFVNHFFSYFYNKPLETKKQNLASLIFLPYPRVISMHFTIVFGLAFGEALIIFFLVLKTLADVIMHIREHNILRQGDEHKTENENKK